MSILSSCKPTIKPESWANDKAYDSPDSARSSARSKSASTIANLRATWHRHHTWLPHQQHIHCRTLSTVFNNSQSKNVVCQLLNEKIYSWTKFQNRTKFYLTPWVSYWSLLECHLVIWRKFIGILHHLRLPVIL